MNSARSGHRAVRLSDGRVLIIGGSYLSSAEIFDPKTEQFIPTGSMSIGKYGHEAALLPDGAVIVVGGRCDGCGYFAGNRVEIYSPNTGTWTQAASIPNATLDFWIGLTDHRVLVRNGKVLVFGGYDGYDQFAYSAVYSYDPASDTWTILKPMSVGRAAATATLLSDGRVLIIGGNPIWGPSWKETEIYDPTGGTDHLGSTTPGPTLNAARRYHAAVQFSDGSILVAGGDNQCYWCALNVLSSSEFLSSVNGSWVDGGSMAVGRDVFTMTVLSNGQAIAVGGITPTLTVTGTSEIWKR